MVNCCTGEDREGGGCPMFRDSGESSTISLKLWWCLDLVGQGGQSLSPSPYPSNDQIHLPFHPDEPGIWGGGGGRGERRGCEIAVVWL